MTAFTGRAPFTTLDARIARALVVLRQARTTAARTASAAALQTLARAEEDLDALLDHRRAFGQRLTDGNRDRAVRSSPGPGPAGEDHPRRTTSPGPLGAFDRSRDTRD